MNPRMSGIADDARGDRRDRERIERLHVAFEAGLLARGQIEVVHTELAGLGEQRVVDVGHVAHALHRVAHVDQPSLQHVVGDERGRVTEMGGVVRRDAARVHRHLIVGFEWYDGARAPCRRDAWSAQRPRVFADSRQLGCDTGLVAHVELQEHSGERLDCGRVRQLAGIERATAGDLGRRSR